MKDGAVRLREISLARDTLKLAPGQPLGCPLARMLPRPSQP